MLIQELMMKRIILILLLQFRNVPINQDMLLVRKVESYRMRTRNLLFYLMVSLNQKEIDIQFKPRILENCKKLLDHNLLFLLKKRYFRFLVQAHTTIICHKKNQLKALFQKRVKILMISLKYYLVQETTIHKIRS